jgi:Zn-dependent protease
MLFNLPVMLSLFLQSLIAVGIAFVLHELGHKFMAQKKGLWAEFRAWPIGLVLAVGMAILSQGGFVFAAPGATMISPVRKHKFGYSFQQLNVKDIGQIGLIGPVVSIALSLIFVVLALIVPITLFRIGAQVNAWLAIFNLIPLSILDGQKVWQWSWKIWAGFFALSIVIFGLTVAVL